MKKFFKTLGIFALVMALVFSFTTCDGNGGDENCNCENPCVIADCTCPDCPGNDNGTPVPFLAEMVSAGSHTMAIKIDGTLWAWGWNSTGRLGLGNSVETNTPTRVGTETNWSSVSAGSHTMAIKNNGTLWAWGDNSAGQLGLGNFEDRNTPTQVGTETNWSSVSAGSAYTMAIKSDGTLWAWGWNNTGQLGLGVSGAGTERNVPTRVEH